MAKKDPLTDEVKRFVVRCLAFCHTPTQTAALVHEQFKLKMTRQNVQNYDPTTVTGKDLSEEYAKLFWETREEYLGDIKAVPLANQVVRLRELQRLYERALDDRNDGAARAILEQIAKEEGGAYTNLRKNEHTGKDGKELPIFNLHLHGNGSTPPTETDAGVSVDGQ